MKKMRPSGENLSETGKLRPVRTGVTGERVWTDGNIAEPVTSITAQSVKMAFTGWLRDLTKTNPLPSSPAFVLLE